MQICVHGNDTLPENYVGGIQRGFISDFEEIM
jgi:hypothetical protein